MSSLLDRGPFDAVIFDCDGVLVDSERLEERVLGVALGWLDGEVEPRTIAEVTKGGSMAEMIDEIRRHTRVPENFQERYRALQLEMMAEVEMVPGADLAVQAAGQPRAVASGGPRDKMMVSLPAHDLWDRFAPHVYSCYDIGSHKPEPDVYLHAAKALGVLPERCLVVEDSITGTTAGAAAAMTVIGLSRDTDPDDLVAAGAALVLPDMTEVARAIGEVRL